MTPANANASSIEFVAIINSFNRKELLRRALDSLAGVLRRANFNSAIIAFDAGSTDGSRQFLDDWAEANPADKLMVVAPSEGNPSFSEGVNVACGVALRKFPECRWLFLYETDNWIGDVQPLKQAISLLKSQPRLGAVGFTVRKHAGSPCGYGMRFPTPLSLALGQNVSFLCDLHGPKTSPWQEKDGSRWRTCDVVFTSPLLIRRETWEQSGGLDAQAFPFSDTDLDWAWRCAKLGWQMAVIETSDVVHDNLEQASAWSETRVLDFHRNRLRLLKRHVGNRVAAIKPLLFLRHVLEALILSFKSAGDPASKKKLAGRRRMLRTVWSDYV